MLIALFPLLVAALGLFMYVLASNSKLQEVGRILFACGALITTHLLAAKFVNLL